MISQDTWNYYQGSLATASEEGLDLLKKLSYNDDHHQRQKRACDVLANMLD